MKFVTAFLTVSASAVIDDVCDIDCLNDDGCDIIRQVDTQQQGDSPNDYTKGKLWFSDTAHVNESKWMATLSDNTKLEDLYLPGTHDSGSIRCVDERLDYQYRCQTWSWQRQLDAGIRVFDIRIRWDPCDGSDKTHQWCSTQDLPIYHGSAEQKPPHWKEVTKIFKDFLEANPTEFIMARLKDEGSEAPNANTCCPAFATKWEDAVWKVINKTGLGSAFEPFYHYNKTVKDARGKFITLPIGSELTSVYPYEDQDDWQPGDLTAVNPVPENGFPRKWKSITDFNAKAKPAGKVYIQFLSSVWLTDADFPKPPMEMAYGINGRFWNDFSTPAWKKAMYLFDFPGTGVVKQVIKANFGTVTKPDGSASMPKHILRAERNKDKSTATKVANMMISVKSMACSQAGGKKNMGDRTTENQSSHAIQIRLHLATVLVVLGWRMF